MTPSELAARETARFVREVTAPPATVLDVGCGAGELAACLAQDGFVVHALDGAATAVAAACARGIDARLASWPTFACAPCDVVVFSRSLHHIAPLDAAVACAAEALAPGGAVVVEEFAYVEASAAARRWLDRVARMLRAAGVLEPRPESLLAHLLAAPSVEHAWERARPDVHPAAAIEAALRERFASVRAWRVPYLFRWLVEALPDDARGGEVLAWVLELERDRGAGDPGFFVGRRFVATEPR